MANWKTHLIVGALVSLIYFLITIKWLRYDLKVMLMSLPIIFYFSLLPDIDHRLSKVTGIMLLASTIFIAIGYLPVRFEWLNRYISPNLIFFGLVILMLTIITSSNIIKHRGIMHTIYAVFLMPLLLLIIVPLSIQYLYLYGFAFVAYWSHMWADGIPFKLSLD